MYIPYVNLVEIMTFGVAHLDPKGMIGKICEGYRRTTKYCYLLNIQALDIVVSEKIFFLL